MVDVFPPAKTASGRRSLHHASAEARSAASTKRLGRMPGSSGTRCNLSLSHRGFRARGVVGGRKSGHQPSTLGHCSCAAWICRLPTNRLPRSFAAPPIPARWTSARDPNGHACCGMRWSANRILNRWISSLSAKAESTTAHRGLPAALRGLLPEHLDCLRKQPCKMI